MPQVSETFIEELKLQSLYPDFQTYKYMENQGELFDRNLEYLYDKYAGKYIIFEDGKVLDSDDSEDSLLDRTDDFRKINKLGLNGLFIERVPEIA